MRIETRVFKNETFLVLVCESEEESQKLDLVFGNKVKDDSGLIADVFGEVRLSDGYGDHYIRLKEHREN